jgi:hypothetical protein
MVGVARVLGGHADLVAEQHLLCVRVAAAIPQDVVDLRLGVVSVGLTTASSDQRSYRIPIACPDSIRELYGRHDAFHRRDLPWVILHGPAPTWLCRPCDAAASAMKAMLAGSDTTRQALSGKALSGRNPASSCPAYPR